MKNRNQIFSDQDSPPKYQGSSVNSFSQAFNKEIKPLMETARQLYATEVEEYFFYFLAVQENKLTGLAA